MGSWSERNSISEQQVLFILKTLCFDLSYYHYLEGGNDEVADFQVTFPKSTSNELLQFQERGVGLEHGSDGCDTDFSGFSWVQNDGHDNAEEFVLVHETQRCQGVDDMGTESLINSSVFGERDQAFDGRWNLGVAESHEGKHFLIVILSILESFNSDAAVFVDSVSFASSTLTGAGESNQVAERQSDGGFQFPLEAKNKTKKMN